MFKKKHNIKLTEELKYVSFYFQDLGIIENDGFEITDISKHIKTFENSFELESELNKLSQYIYDDKRRIHFNEFRQFPYITHGDNNLCDFSILAKNYTNLDIYLIKFIRKFVKYIKNGEYSFFDVDFIIKNTRKIEIKEYSIFAMPIDEVLRL
ncbi:hypothetical protein HMPREF1092_03223 [Clostridium thermobutyricum]|uniref:Uncharacterized protein n=1 Tax=Clostridium thermobutyricum TaxID=29372 RepID=N9XIF0_9CLOT|nr:hypothetical protein [Clostridium thermobutyricum]ENY99482.1 hypothetical protein HMPREF1092_03223 [Clostridium thermobutyricum]